MALILVGVTIIAAVLIQDTNTKPTNPSGQSIDWQTQLIKETEMHKENLAQPQIPAAAKQEMEKQIAINEYRLEYDIPPMNNTSLWGFVQAMVTGLFSLISVFTIVVGAGSVAQEFSSGTIKMLLIRPYRRWKILLSKYMATLLFAAGMMVLLFVAAFIVGGISFGFSGLEQPYLAYIDGQILERSMITQVLIDYGFSCVSLLLLSTMAFMISTVFRSGSLAIGLGIFLLFMGSTLVTLLSKYSWVKYILFANLNLRMYFDGVPLVEGMTLGFSAVVLAVYFLAFHIIAYLFFIKRDVA